MSTPSGYVNPIGAGLQPARIDMGVDYTGSGKLYAMGAGTITNIYNTGWPGGKFIGLHLDTGQYMYYAENINVASGLQTGQRVKAGQQLGTAVGSYPYVEVGWAAPPGTGQTMAAATGEAATGSDPGAKSTAYGVSMSNLIASLGGPAGILTPGGVTGSVSSGFPSGSTAQSSSSNTALSGCVPLIWVVWYAVQYSRKPRRNLSCGWRKRQSPHEKRKQRRRRGTSETATRFGFWHHFAA